MKGPIAIGTIRTSLVLGLRFLFQAGTLLLVARMLGADGFGIFAGVAALAVVMGTMATFGTHLVLLKEVSRESSRREQVLPYAIGCTLLCGGMLLAAYSAITLFMFDGVSVPLSVLLVIGFTEMLLQPLLLLIATEHHAEGRIARAQLLQLLPMGLRLVAGAIVFSLHLSDPLSAYALGYVAASAVALFYGKLRLSGGWPSWRRWRLPRRREWTESFGFAAINVTKAGPAELDKILALKLLPSSEAGLYAVGARIIGAATLPVTAMTLSALPRLFREGRGTHDSLRLTRWMFCVAFGYGVLLAGLLWLTAPLFKAILGVQYQDIGGVIRWLCFAMPGMTLRLVIGNLLMASGSPWMRVAFEATGLVVLLLASASLVGYLGLGAIGMPIALALAEWAMTIFGTGLIIYIHTVRRHAT